MTIKKLSDDLTNLIAAGEVVERPLSIVKELVENSLDAQAKNIDINLVESGLSVIKVKDDGIGMSKEDAKMSFQRHTTSKIYTKNDLFNIATLGFRGEALASIASISKMTIESSNGEDYSSISIKAGKVTNIKSTKMNRGTIISVENMFFNTPARLQFVKSLTFELSLITKYIQKIAFAYPQVRFSLVNNNKTIVKTTGNKDILKTVAEIYGIDVARSMNAISFQNYDYRVKAYFSNPGITKSNKNAMVLIVNNRVVRNYRFDNTIVDAYGMKLFASRYPISILIINCDPLLVDVNIHPNKQEIKLTDERKLLALIKNNIHDKLYQVTSHYEIKAKENKTYQEDILAANYEWDTSLQENDISNYLERSYDKDDYFLDDVGQENIEVSKERLFPKLTFIGEVLKTYFICEGYDGMYIIDKHAADERINYEYYLEEFAKEKLLYYDLLIPITLSYPRSEMIRISNKINEIKSLGINLELLSETSFIVRAVPNYFNRKGLEKAYIEEIIENVLSDKPLELRDKLAKSLACKKSIKANYTTTKEEATELINSLAKCKNPFNCAHGRPTIIKYSKYELEKLFLRV